MNLITAWFKRTFSDPQVIALTLALLVGFAVVFFFGAMLAPVLASLVIAYLLEGLVLLGEGSGMPRLVAVVIVFLLFIMFVTLIIFGVMPLAFQQLTELVQQTPAMLAAGQKSLMRLPELYPDLVDSNQITDLINVIKAEMASFAQRVLSLSASSVVGLITILVYFILVPLLVFFFLKDKSLIINWLLQFFPSNRGIVDQVWKDVDVQIANYVRGKFWEITIVGVVSYITFTFFGLNYALLLAVLVGLSVIIPYIGAAVVTVPVLIVAWFQWGWGGEFIYLTIAYLIIQALDGNALVPLLFSEVVNLHPVAIIVSILLFGGLWGFWGVFFAIPLGTLVKAVLTAWPKRPDREAVT
ncbi:AI-2E family transporter [Solemya velum gill symbiont]|uniref:AI-2E family transporter n=1 Tax=Solemya velum gill symbiont TaxID=2340 RepID=UPI00099783A6|nr:AI-2E family transporter [Solemya velum gill symbiont]OOY53850.1 AI-2E family transporter [Solemya velum gill symbiont]OOY57649.1 AI-2E family transporter [Solemya velum gill symbiont]OOY58673.1 AI-2E family transporter [Solemya velum gill symbiont]OOY61308.1 AI-2E family transporter [Solemya velum gill symbiont]OOY62838.1 AI-2E family transporter [Solemya velum gill symbiont]